jgi:hypothetical protein
MKHLKKLILFAAIMLAFTAASFAQVSATATATATIVSPIAIANAGNMNFGNVAVSASGGTVILDPAGTRSITGGVTLPSTVGTVSAAHFNVTGAPAYTYTIAISGSPLTITHITLPANTMTVTAFTSTPSGTGTLSGAGAQTIDVGATLNVAASQVGGTYVSGTPFTVTVNYN